ncbi:phage tail tape measure protein [Methylorubrum zatmanii]
MSSGPLDVSLRVRMRYEAGGARQALGDLDQVTARAQKLGGLGADKLGRDLREVSGAAQGAGRALGDAATQAAKLGGEGAGRLEAGLKRIEAPAREAARRVEDVGRAAARFGSVSTVSYLARDLQAMAAPADRARRELVAMGDAAGRLGRSDGVRAMSRELAEANREAASLHRRIDGLHRQQGLAGVGGRIRASRHDFGNEALMASGLGGGLRFGMSGAAVGGLAAGGGIAATAAMAARATREAISFEAAMAEVRKAIDDITPERFAALERTILKSSAATGIAKEQMAQLVAEAGFAGRPTEELARFAEFGAKAAGAFGMTASATGDALAKMGNVFKLNQAGIEDLADGINMLGDTTAAKERQIVDFLYRTGSAGQAIGLTALQTGAIGAAIISTGKEAEVAATGFNALVTKLGTADRQSKDFQGGLRSLGLSARQVKKDLAANPVEAVLGLLDKINKLPDAKKLDVTSRIGGLEYGDDLLAYAGAVDQIRAALGKLQDQSTRAGSVEKTFKIFDATTQRNIARMTASIDGFATRIGRAFTPAVNTAAAAVERWFNAMNKAMDRRAEAEALAGRMAKGETLSPKDQARIDADPRLKDATDKALFFERRRLELETNRGKAKSDPGSLPTMDAFRQQREEQFRLWEERRQNALRAPSVPPVAPATAPVPPPTPSLVPVPAQAPLAAPAPKVPAPSVEAVPAPPAPAIATGPKPAPPAAPALSARPAPVPPPAPSLSAAPMPVQPQPAAPAIAAPAPASPPSMDEFRQQREEQFRLWEQRRQQEPARPADPSAAAPEAAPLPGTGKRSELSDEARISLASYHDTVERSLERTERTVRDAGRRMRDDLAIGARVDLASLMRTDPSQQIRIERASLGGGSLGGGSPGRGYGGGSTGGLGSAPERGSASGSGAAGGARVAPGRFGGLIPPRGNDRRQDSPAGNGAAGDGAHEKFGNGGGTRGAARTGQMMSYAMDQLRREGVPEDKVRESAAHLVGQAHMESGLDPNKVHDGGTGFGIYGARDPSPGRGRRTDMFNWLEKNGYARNSAEGQMRYMAHEAMSGRYKQTRRILMGEGSGDVEHDTNTITREFESPKYVNRRSGAVRNALRVGPEGNPTGTHEGAGAAQAGENGKFDPLGGAARRYSSGYGMREHPVHGGRRMHHGQDMAAPGGTAVYSMQAGEVSKIDRNGDVTVTHPDGSTKTYRHITPGGIRQGQRVEAGGPLGRLRQHDPRSTGPHLHLEATDREGRRYDPRAEIEAAGRQQAERKAEQLAEKPIEQRTPWTRVEPAQGEAADRQRGEGAVQAAEMPIEQRTPWTRSGAAPAKPSMLTRASFDPDPGIRRDSVAPKQEVSPKRELPTEGRPGTRSPRFAEPQRMEPRARPESGAQGGGLGGRAGGGAGGPVTQNFYGGFDEQAVARRAQLERNRAVRRASAGTLGDVGRPG